MKKALTMFLGVLLIFAIAPSAFAKDYMQLDVQANAFLSIHDYKEHTVLIGISGNYDANENFSIALGAGGGIFKNNLDISGVPDNTYDSHYYANIALKLKLIDTEKISFALGTGFDYKGLNKRIYEAPYKKNRFSLFIGVYGELFATKDLMLYGNVKLPFLYIETFNDATTSDSKPRGFRLDNIALKAGLKYLVTQNVYISGEVSSIYYLNYDLYGGAFDLNIIDSVGLKLSVGYMW